MTGPLQHTSFHVLYSAGSEGSDCPGGGGCGGASDGGGVNGACHSHPPACTSPPDTHPLPLAGGSSLLLLFFPVVIK